MHSILDWRRRRPLKLYHAYSYAKKSASTVDARLECLSKEKSI
jgi:hypothetical protein